MPVISFLLYGCTIAKTLSSINHNETHILAGQFFELEFQSYFHLSRIFQCFQLLKVCKRTISWITNSSFWKLAFGNQLTTFIESIIQLETLKTRDIFTDEARDLNTNDFYVELFKKDLLAVILFTATDRARSAIWKVYI